MQFVSILLIQIRDAADPMAAHEVACLQRRWERIPVKTRVRNVFDEVPDVSWLHGVDVLVIGGSGSYSVHDARSSTWVDGLRRVLARAIDLNMVGMGLCFGHQLLAHHLGGEVVCEPDASEVGTIPVFLTEEGERDPVLGVLGVGPVRVQTGHSDSVIHPPRGLQVLAISDGAAAQAFRVDGGRFYSTQFHPDLTGSEAQARYDALQAGAPQSEMDGGIPRDGLFEIGADQSTVLLRQLLHAFFSLPPVS